MWSVSRVASGRGPWGSGPVPSSQAPFLKGILQVAPVPWDVPSRPESGEHGTEGGLNSQLSRQNFQVFKLAQARHTREPGRTGPENIEEPVRCLAVRAVRRILVRRGGHPARTSGCTAGMFPGSPQGSNLWLGNRGCEWCVAECHRGASVGRARRR